MEQTMLQSVLSASREGREQEAASEPRVSRPLRTKKRPQWWTDCVCESKDELSRLALKVFFFFFFFFFFACFIPKCLNTPNSPSNNI